MKVKIHRGIDDDTQRYGSDGSANAYMKDISGGTGVGEDYHHTVVSVQLDIAVPKEIADKGWQAVADYYEERLKKIVEENEGVSAVAWVGPFEHKAKDKDSEDGD